MNQFNFKSQLATSIEQSERFLALGLKKETADMCLQSTLNDVWSPYIPIAMPYSKIESYDLSKDVFRTFPAWSLHRLIEMIQKVCTQVIIISHRVDIRSNVKRIAYSFDVCDNLYDNIIDCIEWLIKEGYFNKDYLE